MKKQINIIVRKENMKSNKGIGLSEDSSKPLNKGE